MKQNSILKKILMISGLLIIAEMIASFITLQSGVIVVSLFSIITLLFVALYGAVLYKIPHGNILKYALLLLAMTIIVNASSALERGNESSLIHISRLITAAILCYVAGRLHRIKQNKYLLCFCEIVLFVTSAILTSVNLKVVDPILLFRFFYVPITLLCLILAYIVRYKEHRESGLIDRPDRIKKE